MDRGATQVGRSEIEHCGMLDVELESVDLWDTQKANHLSLWKTWSHEMSTEGALVLLTVDVTSIMLAAMRDVKMSSCISYTKAMRIYTKAMRIARRLWRWVYCMRLRDSFSWTFILKSLFWFQGSITIFTGFITKERRDGRKASRIKALAI